MDKGVVTRYTYMNRNMIVTRKKIDVAEILGILYCF